MDVNLIALLENEKTGFLVVFVILYWLYCFYWGIRGAVKAKTASDYFIAGRQLPRWAFVFAATATSFSGWIFLGLPGLLKPDGFLYAYASFYAIAIPFAGVILLKRQWMLGKHFGFVTPGEMLSHYFRSDIIRVLVVIVALCFSVPYLGIQMRASGFLLNTVTDGELGVNVGMWLLSAVMFIYVALGGLRAAAYVDRFHMILLVPFVILLCLMAVGLSFKFGDPFEMVNEGASKLAAMDKSPTSDGYSHYIAIPGVIQFVSSGPAAVGGPWTGIMILTYMFALMGIQSSPAFSMWAFANTSPKPFARQQVWVSSLCIGFILFFFTAIQSIDGYSLGEDISFLARHLDPTNYVLGAGVGGMNLMESASNQSVLVALFVGALTDSTPWFIALISLCALAAMQSTGAAYVSTAGAMLTRDVLKSFVMPNITHKQQKMYARIFVGLILVAALMVATASTDSLALLGGLAVALGFQMWPALLAVCYFPWLTRAGITIGLAVGMVVVVCTEAIGQNLGISAWGRWPWTIHSAGWGIIFNLGLAVIISALTQNRADHEDETKFQRFLAEHAATPKSKLGLIPTAWITALIRFFFENREDREHKMKYHNFLAEHAAVPESKRGLIPAAWIITLAWFFFGIGPGAVIGNTIFGNPAFSGDWLFGIPSIWAWQILWWVLGVFMMWFLAYKMKMSTMPKDVEIEVLHEDIGDVQEES